MTTLINSSTSKSTCSAPLALARLTAFAALATLAAPASTAAQAPSVPKSDAAPASTLAQTPPALKGDAEVLVPPQGSALELPLHVGTVCILSFPEKLGSPAVVSAPNFEIRPWGDDRIAVLAIND